MHSPWLDIPLADYEGHMSLPGIGQAQMLAAELAVLLDEFSPRSVAVIGCSGGNGFDCIGTESTTRVVGIDINSKYIEELSRRYTDRISGLELYIGDIQEPGLFFEPVDLIYAALLFEYIAPEPTLLNLGSLCRPDGFLATVLQMPSRVSRNGIALAIYEPSGAQPRDASGIPGHASRSRDGCRVCSIVITSGRAAFRQRVCGATLSIINGQPMGEEE